MKAPETTLPTKCQGRPASFDRGDLVSTVTDLFWQHGYRNLSFNQISSATGLPRASLYNAFGSKEALFLECMNYYDANSPAALLDEFRSGEMVGPLLYRLFDRLSELRAKDKRNRGCLAADVFSELAASDTRLGAALLAAHAGKSKRMFTLIRQAVKQGELPDETDAEATAQIILAFMNGLSARSKTGASKRQLTTMSRIFLQRMGFEKSP